MVSLFSSRISDVFLEEPKPGSRPWAANPVTNCTWFTTEAGPLPRLCAAFLPAAPRSSQWTLSPHGFRTANQSTLAGGRGSWYCPAPCPLEGASGAHQGHCSLPSPQPLLPSPPHAGCAALAPPSTPGLASQGWGDGFSWSSGNAKWSGGWSPAPVPERVRAPRAPGRGRAGLASHEARAAAHPGEAGADGGRGKGPWTPARLDESLGGAALWRESLHGGFLQSRAGAWRDRASSGPVAPASLLLWCPGPVTRHLPAPQPGEIAPPGAAGRALPGTLHRTGRGEHAAYPRVVPKGSQGGVCRKQGPRPQVYHVSWPPLLPCPHHAAVYTRPQQGRVTQECCGGGGWQGLTASGRSAFPGA